MEGETNYTSSTTKQDFPGEVLSKQNSQGRLASLSCNSFPAKTEQSALFAFPTCEWGKCVCRFLVCFIVMEVCVVFKFKVTRIISVFFAKTFELN